MKLSQTIIAGLVLCGALVSQQTQAATTLKSLPNGNYRICSDRPDASGKESGMCFRFRKTSDRVVGLYYVPYSEWSVCLSGKINNNTVSGKALQYKSGLPEAPRINPKYQGSKLETLDRDGYLKVSGQTLVRSASTENGYDAWFHYQTARLDVKDFHRYSAGSTPPPQSCEVRK